jgi:glycosyltransferase involved in cell wall biosynthesis
MASPRIAIVHDWLYGGGAELVVEQLHKMYPEAPIYTSFCTDEWRKRLDNKVVTGYLQHWPFAQLRKFLPVLRQRWFRKLDLSEFDIVISSSGNGEAKFVLSDQQHTTNNTRPTHVCYCHTPTHFYWRKYNEYLENPSFRPKWMARLGLRLLVKPLRARDYRAAQSVDHFIANSSHIQKDIEEYYGRDSIVIHPPVDVEKWKREDKKQPKQLLRGFIMWGRHVPYKRFDIAIKACNELQLPLTIVGEGPETASLKKIAGPTIVFTGRISDEDLVAHAYAAQAFLFPGEEDLGISPVEALATGLPVIAYRSGGALDYVEEGKTGLFFAQQSVVSLSDCLQSFSEESFSKKVITSKAEQFSVELFREKMAEAVKKYSNT